MSSIFHLKYATDFMSRIPHRAEINISSMRMHAPELIGQLSSPGPIFLNGDLNLRLLFAVGHCDFYQFRPHLSV